MAKLRITATFQETFEFGFEADDWVGSEALVIEHDRVMIPAIVEKVHEETQEGVLLLVDPEVDAAVGKSPVAGGPIVSLQVELDDHAFVELRQFVSVKNHRALSKERRVKRGLGKIKLLLIGSGQTR